MGFDADKFVSGISEDKKCGVCGGVLDNPVRAACGHLYCSGCILPWVVRHGSCPRGCQPLTPGDLENVLPLREIILNLQVRCEYRQRGCQAVVRLTDLIAHIQDCSYRPVTCGHPQCGATVPHRQLAEHEGVACEYRPVGICQEGCGLVLVYKTRHNHHCVTALRQLVNEQVGEPVRVRVVLLLVVGVVVLACVAAIGRVRGVVVLVRCISGGQRLID